MARILVVDDEEDMRMALGNILSRVGHQVYEAGDGRTALEFLGRQPVDLVLLDIRMPGMDGVQILRTLRESDRDTPVIMVTGYGSVESTVEVMRLGASDYLGKPFGNRELIEKVEKVLGTGGAPAGVLGQRLAEKLHGPLAPIAAKAVVQEYEGEDRERRGWLLPGLLLAGVAAGLALWGLRGAGRELRMPAKNPTALVWRGERLWLADWVTQTLHETEVDGRELKPLRSFPLPQTHITGVAIAGDALYLCDPWRKVIEKRRLDEKLTLVAIVPSPGANPAGLFFDGRYLWSADAATRRFYQHETDAGLTVLAAYPAPARSPVAMFKDKDYFWSADAQTRLLYKHRLDNRLKVLAAYSLPLLEPGSAPLSCFTWKGARVWLGRDGSGSLAVRRLRDFKVVPPGG
ncbi:MAG: response regulator [Elusimicrobiota bacterium]